MQADVTIRYAGLEGQGVGVDCEGNLYFVFGVIPGDHVRVEYGSQKKRYRDATLISILNESKDRVTPQCSFFKECGGCEWLHWRYEAQIASKENNLLHMLKRADLSPETIYPCLPSPKTTGYRTRVQLRQQGSKIGFFRRRTNELVAIESCLVCDPRINEEIAKLRSEKNDPNEQRKIELTLDEIGQVNRTINAPHADLGFTQTNQSQNRKLKETLTRWVSEADSKLVLELYCGDGNLTSAYLDKVVSVLGVDTNARSISKACMRFPKKFSGIVSSIHKKLRQSLPHDLGRQYDTLILDPPRAGVGEILNTFIHERLRSIIYISCSPLTFSQDVKNLKKHGFRFVRLQPIDMFPHTRHLELVALFLR